MEGGSLTRVPREGKGSVSGEPMFYTVYITLHGAMILSLHLLVSMYMEKYSHLKKID